MYSFVNLFSWFCVTVFFVKCFVFPKSRLSRNRTLLLLLLLLLSLTAPEDWHTFPSPILPPPGGCVAVLSKTFVVFVFCLVWFSRTSQNLQEQWSQKMWRPSQPGRTKLAGKRTNSASSQNSPVSRSSCIFIIINERLSGRLSKQ